MKFIHLSDLHIGKRLIDVSLLEDQRYIFDEILDILGAEQPDAVLIAGDIYDRANPSAEAMELLDYFLNRLSKTGKPVFIVSGNHDSPERLSFARSFLEKGHITISPVYQGHIAPVSLTDEYGEVCLWLMPYVRPETAAPFFGDKAIRNANDAVEAVIGEMEVDPSKRNVIISHQFVTGGTVSDSERKNIGTLENVNAALYAPFDYVALGHLHRPQNIGREDGTMRYSGTPLMYSRSEMDLEKSVTLVEMREKGNISVRTVPLTPRRGMRLARGSFDELIRSGPEPGTGEDYYFIDLTDEEDIPNAAARLRERFPYLLGLHYDNRRTNSAGSIDAPEAVEEKSPMELVRELYQLINKKPMSEEAEGFVLSGMKKVEGLRE